MSSNLTTRGNMDLAALGNIAQNIQNVANSLPSGGLDPYLRMGKDGIWVYGAESFEVERGSIWAINPLSLEHGFVCWERQEEGSRKAANKLGEVMVPASQPLPAYTSLPDYGHEWTEQVSIIMVCTTGEDAGTQVQYSVTSKGGIREMKTSVLEKMQKQIAAQPLPLDPAVSRIVPLVKLANSSYNHKAYGKIYTPVLEIVGWGTLDDQSPETKEGGKTATAEPANGATREPDGQEAPRRRNRVRA